MSTPVNTAVEIPQLDDCLECGCELFQESPWRRYWRFCSLHRSAPTLAAENARLRAALRYLVEAGEAVASVQRRWSTSVPEMDAAHVSLLNRLAEARAALAAVGQSGIAAGTKAARRAAERKDT